MKPTTIVCVLAIASAPLACWLTLTSDNEAARGKADVQATASHPQPRRPVAFTRTHGQPASTSRSLSRSAQKLTLDVLISESKNSLRGMKMNLPSWRAIHKFRQSFRQSLSTIK